MRRTTTVLRTNPFPKGRVILGAALASWALFIALSASLTQLFAVILKAI